MLELQEIGTERSLHLYRTLAQTFKSVNEHAVSGSKVHGFNPTAYGVLEVLYMKGAQPIQQVGAQLLLQSGNVTYVIDKLEQKGLLHRKHCPQDRRIIFVELTEEGQRTMDDIYPGYALKIDRAVSGLSEEDKELLSELLGRLAHSADRLSASS
ncbi:MarR family transcriptional regulator [Paenibacillus sp. FSL H7-0942]|uniref:MarR family transcriptional regulator n=2 Tax=Bacillales TaxID=1385 RepID=A0ABD8AW68_PAEAM|nr:MULTISPECIES: MarR family transcriptional regulator [Paenibacillus]APO43752.1 MarR family transcriptional regulator [Paenibacillus xylanexedens]ETT40252.1 transcriptional regulator [Paenibacillus sp. FSL R5-192]ETT46824.1 transcriptional regulator [Paenibacillus sp. FSL H7-689]KLU56778.1 MarR family transcriptional regulator [Paenibacillus sp. VT-400]MBY0120119.1 MarR family transcriptional regulator [Paenibacillus xylanexedens]